MSFWSWLTGTDGITPSQPGTDPYTVGEVGYRPGEIGAFDYDPPAPMVASPENRALPPIAASPWSGWPAEWNTPHLGLGPQFGSLVDVAWTCLDLNSSVLASMPTYRLASGRTVKPLPWFTNPDPTVYPSWFEFAKQLFWDFQLGESFVMPSEFFANGRPSTFRVISPWLVNVEMTPAGRSYKIGSIDVTGQILHIRYQSSTEEAHGHGALEVGRARLVAAGVLTEYARRIAETGGQTHEWIGVERALRKSEADDLLDQWVQSRMRNLGYPAVMSGGATLNQASTMSAKDMTLLELSQFNESRIAILLGVPPFLVGLPSGGDSMTYSNTSSLFDFHDRASLRPKAVAVMTALSGWALPRGQSIELNRDEYTRPALPERSSAYATLHAIEDETGRVLSAAEIRQMERLQGDPGAAGLTSGLDASEEVITDVEQPLV